MVAPLYETHVFHIRLKEPERLDAALVAESLGSPWYRSVADSPVDVLYHQTFIMVVLT